jgi:hypothetical protein
VKKPTKSGLPSTLSLLFATALLLALGATGHAQTYSIDWYTIDGGGGVSAGGSYTLGGSIGEPDTGTITGGSYTLEGGFWPGVPVPPPPPTPTLFIQLLNLEIIVSWAPATPGFTLEQADDLSTPIWAPAPTGNPVTIPPTNGTRFYRLRKP